jgi:hypothetical protein
MAYGYHLAEHTDSHHTSQRYWNSCSSLDPRLFGTHAMGNGGVLEIYYRHYFELRHFRHLVHPNRNTNVLELGSGNGRWMTSLAPHVATYTGVDFSERAVEISKSEAQRRGFTNVRICRQSLTEFKGDIPYDIVYFSGVSQYLQDDEFSLVIANLEPQMTSKTIIVDRSTVNYRRRETVSREDYFSIYRTPQEIADLVEGHGFRLARCERSYRFLRCTRLLTLPYVRRLVLALCSSVKPVSYYALAALSFVADTVKPLPFEGGDRSHDFLLFERSE